MLLSLHGISKIEVSEDTAGDLSGSATIVRVRVYSSRVARDASPVWIGDIDLYCNTDAEIDLGGLTARADPDDPPSSAR